MAQTDIPDKIGSSLRPVEGEHRRLTTKPLPTAFRVSSVLVFGVPVDLRGSVIFGGVDW